MGGGGGVFVTGWGTASFWGKTLFHAVSHSLSQSVGHSVSRSLTQTVSRSLTQSVTHSLSHSVSQSVTGSKCQWCHIISVRACTSRDTAVGIVAGLPNGRSAVRIPTRNVLISPAVRPYRLCFPPSILSSGYRSCIPGVKRPGREVDPLPPSSAEVNNEWS